jgi:DNA replication protein DnaC
MGKTHLAISLAVATAASGRRARYARLRDLIAKIEESHVSGQLMHRLHAPSCPALTIIDQTGDLTISRTGASCLRARTVASSKKAEALGPQNAPSGLQEL